MAGPPPPESAAAASPARTLLLLPRLVGQVGPQPALDLGQREAAPVGVVRAWSLPIRPTVKYRDAGWANIRPLTLAAGVIANDSVRAMPSCAGAEQVEQLPLQAVVRAGRVAERRAGCRGTARRAGPPAPGSASGSNHSRRACRWMYSANASASRSASAFTMIAR